MVYLFSELVHTCWRWLDCAVMSLFKLVPGMCWISCLTKYRWKIMENFLRVQHKATLHIFLACLICRFSICRFDSMWVLTLHLTGLKNLQDLTASMKSIRFLPVIIRVFLFLEHVNKFLEHVSKVFYGDFYETGQEPHWACQDHCILGNCVLTKCVLVHWCPWMFAPPIF